MLEEDRVAAQSRIKDTDMSDPLDLGRIWEWFADTSCKSNSIGITLRTPAH